MPILVRAGELYCYRSFGHHDWSPAVIGLSSVPQDIVLSERPAPFPHTRARIPLAIVPEPDSPTLLHD